MIWFYHILSNNDVSLHNLVVLVVTIPTSPRLPKTEFVCGRYCVFGIGCFKNRILEKGEKEKRAPASLPAWAGSQAGPFGQVPGHSTGLGRFHGRPPREGLRPLRRPGPVARPAHPGAPLACLLAPCPPACLPAWAGSQAGRFGWHSGLPAGLGRFPGRAVFPLLFPAHKIVQRLHFWGPYLRGFFPKNKPTFEPTPKLFSLSPLLTS